MINSNHQTWRCPASFDKFNNRCYDYARYHYLDQWKEMIQDDDFEYPDGLNTQLRFSRRECRTKKPRLVGDWGKNAQPPNCPGVSFLIGCEFECFSRTGFNTNIYFGQISSADRVMSSLRIRALIKHTHCSPACTASVSITQYPNITPEHPGWPSSY